MIKPDLITVNATHIDFPAFRYYVRNNRSLFSSVIVALSEHCGKLNLGDFIQGSMIADDVSVLAPLPFGRRDWRDVATHHALSKCSSEWILFIEQDFIIKNHSLLETTLNGDHFLVGFNEGNRLHPAFLMIRRDILLQTSMDFSARPPEHDHFGCIWKDLQRLGYSALLLEDLGFKSPVDWEHLAGITHNYTLLMTGSVPCYQVERFKEYNQYLLALDIEQDPRFLQVIQQASEL